MKLSGNTILITGGSSGIGLELAKALHALGNRVIISGRRKALLDEVAAAYPGITPYVHDMADGDSIPDFSAQVIKDHPDLNMLIHNAGLMQAETLSAAPSDLGISEQTVAVNLLGPIRLTHALLPHLAGRPGSAIITVSSGLAFVPLAITPAYCATKAAIHSWSQSLRQQLKASGTRVLEIAPPAVQTDLMPGSRTNPNYMPLDQFISETMAILQSDPVPDEICVERVRFLRDAEREGRADQVFQMLNQLPH